MMETRSGEVSNTCPVRYSARFRSVMSVMVTSTRSNAAGGRGNVIVNKTVTLCPFRVWRTLSPSKDVRPSAMAIICSTKASRLSGTNTLCSETRSSSLLSAANSLTDASLTSTTFTIVMACCLPQGHGPARSPHGSAHTGRIGVHGHVDTHAEEAGKFRASTLHLQHVRRSLRVARIHQPRAIAVEDR